MEKFFKSKFFGPRKFDRKNSKKFWKNFQKVFFEKTKAGSHSLLEISFSNHMKIFNSLHLTLACQPHFACISQQTNGDDPEPSQHHHHNLPLSSIHYNGNDASQCLNDDDGL